MGYLKQQLGNWNTQIDEEDGKDKKMMVYIFR